MREPGRGWAAASCAFSGLSLRFCRGPAPLAACGPRAGPGVAALGPRLRRGPPPPRPADLSLPPGPRPRGPALPPEALHAARKSPAPGTPGPAFSTRSAVLGVPCLSRSFPPISCFSSTSCGFPFSYPLIPYPVFEIINNSGSRLLRASVGQAALYL